MSDLRTAILARCALLERLANEAAVEMGGDSGPRLRWISMDLYYKFGIGGSTSEHMDLWSPGSVLALVAGARAMVAEHPTGQHSNGAQFCEPCDDAAMQTGSGGFDYPCVTMALLADMIGVKADD